MHVDVVWLTAALLSFPLLTLCDPLYIMSTPQILQVGTPVRVLVEVQDYTGTNELTVNIRIMDFPKKQTELASTSVLLNQKNQYLALVSIEIPFDEHNFDVDSEIQQFVYIKSSWSNGKELEKKVMVSYQSGYIYVFTDKTIYTPDSDVKYRLFVLNADALPASKSVTVNMVTPDNIIVETKQLAVNLGVASGIYKLPDPVNNGTWKISATFTDNPLKNFTSEFEVKEYRLPSFDIKLNPVQSFYYIDDNEDFKVNIEATYLFGQKVDGSAFVVFGVLNNNEKIGIRSSLKRVPIRNGQGEAVLRRQDLTQTFPNINELLDKSLYMSANILTDTGSEMVEAERRGMYIVASPYTILFTKTPKYFKPGMPFYFMVYVTNPDGTPAEKIQMLAQGNNQIVKGRTQTNGIALFTINTDENMSELSITVETNSEKITKPDRQAKKTMKAEPYKSDSKKFLNINMPSGEKIMGSQVKFELFVKSDSSSNHEITYMVLSKGQIVKTSKIKRSGAHVLALDLEITRDMIPSFRMVAYYHSGNSDIVSDSVWVDVMDICMGKLEVGIKDVRPVYNPGDTIELQLTGDPKSKVYLVAVDKGVYVLNNRSRLTQKKIWDVVESHDIGCTFGGGKNNMGVFYDAGLMLTTDSAGTTELRQVPHCKLNPKRKRRAITKGHITQTFLDKYSDSLKKCCMDGLMKNLLGYTCERRVIYIVDGSDCRDAFYDCCTKLAKLEQETVHEELVYARTEEQANEMSNEIQSRSQFPESWMWDIVDLPPGSSNNQWESTVKIKENTLPDSITTWVISAVSMSKDRGICIAEPFEVIVKKEFFIDLKLPYSAVANEQIEIKAIIHYLGNRELKKVYVDFLDNENICSKASNNDKKYRTTVKIDPRSSRAVSFIIIPLKSGKFDIEVKAYSLQPPVGDGVKKKLKVVPPGVLTTTGEITLILEPEKHAGGQQRSEVRRPFLDNQVPGTDAHTYISVTGKPMIRITNEAISGHGLEKLIQAPSGCGEQNLLRMVLPLIATHYLDKTNQWQDIGMNKRAEALQHIQTGHTTQLKYHKSDGGFAIYPNNKSNTWLTAYVVKMFSKASSLIPININVICDGVKWLILNAQYPDGSFVEVGDRPYSSKMEGKSSSVSTTAFVLIALQDTREVCSDVKSLSSSMEKASDYLLKNIAATTESYAVTMASYALSNADKLNRDVLFNFASLDKSHWPVYTSGTQQVSKHFTLEATGFALLALLKVGDYKSALPVVRWLKTNQAFEGGYRSTQATAVVFEAVAKYMVDQPLTEGGEMIVNVISSARTKSPFKGLFNKKTRGLQRTDKFVATGDLTVTVSGQGEGSISIRTLYYAKPDENSTKCTSFELAVKMTRDKQVSHPSAVATYTLYIETRYLKDRFAPMTILDIGMLTGFEVDKTDLDNLMRTDKYIEKYETKATTFSPRGSLIIYLKQVSNTDPDRIVFRMHQTLGVGACQPASITVYEYYDPANRCVKFYDTQTDSLSGSLSIVCPTDVCSCAEANCATQKWPEVPEESKRNEEACNNKDYVYKARLKKIVTSGTTVTYTFTITDILNAGTDTVVLNDDRDFVGHSRCREKLNLKENKSYLLMGSQPTKTGEGSLARYRYLLDSATWIEYWPTQHESQENVNNDRDRYIGVKDLADTLEQHGCGT